MIPSSRWFPSGLQDRAAWFQNFSTQFAAVAVSLGFTAADGTAVDKDNQIMQFLADSETQLKAYSKAVTQYRKLITEGDIGDPTPEFPANPAFALPVVQPTGIFERLNNLVERIRVAPNYTAETGALLGIIPTTSESIAPGDVKPSIHVFAAQTGYEFSVVAEKREKSDSWNVEIRRAGLEKWETVKTATGKSVNVVITPTTPDKPEQLQIRVQLLKNNENYGQSSDIVPVTVNP